MADFPSDIYTDPSNIDFDTLANLGPLAPLAGLWKGQRGLGVKPKAEGPKKYAYVERIELQPIDPQTNGPQLLYGLRYHTHVTKPGQVKTCHDQVSYRLWEPATGIVIRTLTIRHARREELRARRHAGPRDLGHLLRAVPAARLPNDGVPHQGDRERRRHLGLRGRHGADVQGPEQALPPHRPQHADEGRRAHADLLAR